LNTTVDTLKSQADLQVKVDVDLFQGLNEMSRLRAFGQLAVQSNALVFSALGGGLSSICKPLPIFSTERSSGTRPIESWVAHTWSLLFGEERHPFPEMESNSDSWVV
jgi:hypothetical protein